MLLRLNGIDISLDDIATVERELGRKLRYEVDTIEGTSKSRSSGHKSNRKTVQEMHCKQSQSATFPEPTKVPQLRYTIDGNAVPEPLQIESDDDNTGDDGFSKEDMEVLRRELRLGLVIHDCGGGHEVESSRQDVAACGDATWNSTIQSFDGLANDQRCLVREKSKHSADASLKDNPFNANVVLDNMIQAERSRY
ncbi:hypothetical protein AaE_011165 [Aphanomyces astaci]|uniref:Uncharacterized protein n=1 Tax=Aphanomyces astaci TaxID=112090 RepID=A0A6A4ZLA2_APHAT|nr:hypothetical protein AaE_011165 [Aphanomyces astaci]